MKDRAGGALPPGIFVDGETDDTTSGTRPTVRPGMVIFKVATRSPGAGG
jgi:hypothetical protein